MTVGVGVGAQITSLPQYLLNAVWQHHKILKNCEGGTLLPPIFLASKGTSHQFIISQLQIHPVCLPLGCQSWTLGTFVLASGCELKLCP